MSVVGPLLWGWNVGKALVDVLHWGWPSGVLDAPGALGDGGTCTFQPFTAGVCSISPFSEGTASIQPFTDGEVRIHES